MERCLGFRPDGGQKAWGTALLRWPHLVQIGRALLILRKAAAVFAKGIA